MTMAESQDTEGSLEKRRAPVQARAQQSHDAILKTAARLLDEVGMEGFNTNLLAERAGVKVRTVYRYFPNKYAVLVALTEAMAVKWDTWMTGLYRSLGDPGSDWRQGLDQSIDHWVARSKREPGSVALTQAMNATPQLQAVHQHIHDEICEKMAAAFKQRGLPLARAKRMAMARTVTTALIAGTDYYLKLNGRAAADFLQEMKAQQILYLAPYLDAR